MATTVDEFGQIVWVPDEVATTSDTGPLTGSAWSNSTTDETPTADYSNEGRNYPTTESTQGSGGSPVNASTATTNGLPLVDTTSTTIPPGVINAGVRLLPGLLTAGALKTVTTPSGGGGGVPTGITTPPVNNQDYYNAIQQYYNSYMPSVPKDVVTPLQQWYSGTFNPSVKNSINVDSNPKPLSFCKF